LGSVTILETERTLLREFVPEDVDALARVLSDAETMRYYPAPYDRQGVIDWINRSRWRYTAEGHGLWGMILKSTGELVGDCGLVQQMVDGVDETEISYHLRRDLWGQGLATEAARACRDYGFEKLEVPRLISLIRPENEQSRRVAEKNGLRVVKDVVWKGILHCVYGIDRSAAAKALAAGN